MLSMSGGELLLVLVIALLALGAHRLPEAGKTVGKTLRDMQRAMNEARDSMGAGPDEKMHQPPERRTPNPPGARRLSD
jgi:TatA/E family protein of Tat protein translocase